MPTGQPFKPESDDRKNSSGEGPSGAMTEGASGQAVTSDSIQRQLDSSSSPIGMSGRPSYLSDNLSSLHSYGGSSSSGSAVGVVIGIIIVLAIIGGIVWGIIALFK